MHKYLRAIGYCNISSEKELNYVLQDVENIYTQHELIALDSELDYCEYRMDSSKDMGLCVCGITDIREEFRRHYYYPYFKGTGVTTVADVTLEKRMDKEYYAGICEDSKVGITMIFHLLNSSELRLVPQIEEKGLEEVEITLSGLCNEGTVLFPVMKSPSMQRISREESKNRSKLLSAARNGDQTAMESLTLDDIDIYSKVSRRLINEDVFSIVDTYFMPYGIECDQYSILGEILEVETRENWQTGEEIYVLTLNVNELKFDVCVPVKNVTGEIAVGRRFKGVIWLQGRVKV